jgi:Fur family peroxide stress response transcriptional regulator
MNYHQQSAREEMGQRLAQACRDRAIPLTHQRVTVLETISDRKDHPTAEQIYAEVRRRMPNTSRMTVYRVLDLLVDLGIITKVGHLGSAARFDPTTARHHHLVCVRCDALLDLHDPDLDELDLPSARRLGFKVDDYSILFTGICEACHRKSRSLSKRKKTAASMRSRRRHTNQA